MKNRDFRKYIAYVREQQRSTIADYYIEKDYFLSLFLSTWQKLKLQLTVIIFVMSGANISVNCSNPTLKNRKNRTLVYHNLLSANKSISNLQYSFI